MPPSGPVHAECLHPTSDSFGYSGAACCICDDRPCEAVTVALMQAHRRFDIELWTEAGSLVAPPF